jgi:hypothetical protein
MEKSDCAEKKVPSSLGEILQNWVNEEVVVTCENKSMYGTLVTCTYFNNAVDGILLARWGWISMDSIKRINLKGGS